MNCDLGESYGAFKMGRDEDLIPLCTSVNVACGMHAGDPSSMHRAVRLAKRHQVSLGAHPGLHDLYGFGRREFSVSENEVYDLVVYQLGALAAIAQVEDAALHHVKPHGALYNMSARDLSVARAIASAIRDFDRRLLVYAPDGSALAESSSASGLEVAFEAFADRGYEPDGRLVSRGQEGAVIEDELAAAKRALEMVQRGVVLARDGTSLRVRVDTLCVHGDGPSAVQMLKRIRSELEQAGIEVRHP